MTSLRSIANCIGISGSFSIVRNFYGYGTGVFGHIDLSTDLTSASSNTIKIDPNAPGELSLLNQVRLLQGPHIHLDTIRVGVEDFTTTDEQEIDIAVQITRELYARIGLGIGRVLGWQISTADANGHTVIDTQDEAFDLLDEFTAPGDGMDVFFVRDINFGAGGGGRPTRTRRAASSSSRGTSPLALAWRTSWVTISDSGTTTPRRRT
jgi:hypothetical protein